MGSVFEELIGNPIGEAAAFAAGLAIHPLLKPLLQEEQNLTWSLYRSLPLDPDVAAAMVARNIVTDAGTGAAEAALSGISTSRFDLLTQLAVVFPDISTLIELRRRTVLPPDDLVPALQRQGFTAEYAGFLAQLVDARLSPQQVALGIVRSLIKDPGLMPVDLDTSGGVVPAYAQSTLDALLEAADAGIDEDRLRVMVGSIGLPMSTQQAANAFFRGIIKRGDYNRSILEGDVRPEWADAILAQARQYPSAHDFIENRLRGWSQDDAMYAGTAMHGMSQADTALLFQNQGRPLSWHQVFIGLARGGVYDGPTTDIAAPFLKALQESNIRPEWYNLAWAQRYTYPAAFVLRALTQDHDIDQPTSENILIWEGWEPGLAKTVSTKWYGGTTTTAAQKKQTLSHLLDEYLSGALTRDALTTTLTTGLGYTAEQAANEITLAEFNATKAVRTKNTKLAEKQYVAVKTSEAQARQQLAELGWPANVIDNYIAAWNIERGIQVTTLTVPQIAAALKAGALLASVARPLLADLGEDPNAIETIIATAGADPNT